MKTILLRSIIAAAVIATPTWAQPTTAPTTAPVVAGESAEEMFAAINAIQPPPIDQSKVGDEAYMREWSARREVAFQQYKAANRAFVLAHPSDPRAASVAVNVVSMAVNDEASYKAAADEMLALPIADAAKSQIRALGVQRQIMAAGDDLAAATKLVDDYAAANPGDESAGMLSYMIADRLNAQGDPSRLRKLAAEMPDSPYGRRAAGALRQADGVGKPFTLTFNDAITGRPIDVQSNLRGKVIVIDFWATWCGPCVAEMPVMKQLYAEYKDKGVEFIGVSLDEEGEGLNQLKQFVAENGITWPQYYQGKGWESEFSMSWGVNGIPCVFVVGKDGNLLTTDGRGEEALRRIFDQQLGH